MPEGTAVERTFVDEVFGRGSVAVMHDITNCLRILDVTEFGTGWTRVHEIKSGGRWPARQMRRAQEAIEALTRGQTLPGGSDNRLFDVDVPYRTRLGKLADLSGETSR